MNHTLAPAPPSWRSFTWGALNSLVGLGFAALSLCLPRPRYGVLLAQSNRGLARLFLSRRGFRAVTLGRVVVTVGALSRATWVHEMEHVAQCERWGPLFLPVYLFWHFRVGYRQNPFELQAQAKENAYRQVAAALADREIFQ